MHPLFNYYDDCFEDQKEYNFLDWFCNDPLANIAIRLQKQSLDKALVPSPNLVQYVVNYGETPVAFNIFTQTASGIPGFPTDNLKSFYLQHNIYDPNTYNCSNATGTPNNAISIGQSYYTININAVPGQPAGPSTVYEGPYNATNHFVLDGVTYTIYKTGILSQTYTTGNPVPSTIQIVTENVTGIDLILPNGSSFISNAVEISNQTISCGGNNGLNAQGNGYTLYSIQYQSASLSRKLPPPPRPN
uniref:Uncharacterized protein n=1 Tax=viral metagenome TaxID=1070528 RepID=A0A6C0K0S1_9ZZZZ